MVEIVVVEVHWIRDPEASRVCQCCVAESFAYPTQLQYERMMVLDPSLCLSLQPGSREHYEMTGF